MLEHGRVVETRARGQSWWRAAAPMRSSTLPVNFPHEQRQQDRESKRLVGHPIPPNVILGQALLRNRADFSFHKAQQPEALSIGDHVSCYAGCSFALGATGSAVVGDFTLAERRARHGRRTHRNRISLPDFLECRYRRLGFSSDRTGATTNRCARPRALLQGSAGTPPNSRRGR